MKSVVDIYMVAGSEALDYGELAIGTLFTNCKDTFRFTVITDSPGDKAQYQKLLAKLAPNVLTRVMDEADCDAQAETFYARYAHVRKFRKGHPCWRKITDPSLFSDVGSNIVVLDPDLYFPNPFHFELTMPGKVMLMRQHRHCLLPAAVVEAAFNMGLPMAHHTDIGVAQHTSLPWEWIDETIGRLGGEALPRVPHIESILWAAIGLKIGGGYLDAASWQCWERTLTKRLALMAGISGPTVLKMEHVSRLKCFHASSGAKAWMVEAVRRGFLKSSKPRLEPSRISPFVEITREQYERGESVKRRYHSALRALRLADPLR